MSSKIQFYISIFLTFFNPAWYDWFVQMLMNVSKNLYCARMSAAIYLEVTIAFAPQALFSLKIDIRVQVNTALNGITETVMLTVIISYL